MLLNLRKKDDGLRFGKMSYGILEFVDDEIYSIMKKVQKNFNLSWSKARDEVNNSIKILYSKNQ